MITYSTMRRGIAVIITFIIAFTCRSQGLTFLNSPDSIDRRTSFDVFTDNIPGFAHKMQIDFDIQIPRTEEVGYMMHIIDTESGYRYNVFYDGRGNDCIELNEESKKNIVKLPFDRKQLKNRKWSKFSLMFDFDKKSIYMSIGEKNVTVTGVSLPESGTFRPKIVFGRCDYLIDVPSFTMRNLNIRGGKNFFFPLLQGRGNIVYDDRGNKVGHVDNPYWAINDQYHWKKLTTLKSKLNAGACYDSKRHRLYYYNREQLVIYDVDHNKISTVKYANRCPVDINLGMGVMDDDAGRIYVYEVYKHDKDSLEASVASLDISTMTWSTESTMQLSSQRHHHGSAKHLQSGKIFIFGGFGNMEYSDKIAAYDIAGHKWRETSLKGKVEPRYFTSMGCDASGRNLYIFSGMGNESGQQSIGRRYFYDLNRVEYPSMKTSRLWSLECGKDYSLVPVRSMVVLDTCFVTLGYQEFMSNSQLHLMSFSISDGSHKILGDNIPIRSDKIATNANIYYDDRLCRYFVTVQEFSDDITSSLSLYSINAQPLTESEFEAITKEPVDIPLFMAVSCSIMLLLEVAGTFIIWYRHRRRQIIENNSKNHVDVAQVRPNAIYLFGGFMAFDRNGRDISYMFTNKLCELTILLLSRGSEGLSSRILGTMLWGDKETDKIKNLRSVTINHLRKVLQEIDGVQLIYSEGYFRLMYDEHCYIDIHDMENVIEHNDIADTDISNKDDLSVDGVCDTKWCSATDYRLLQILKRGKFLRNINSPNLDEFKAKIETYIMPVLVRRMEYTFSHNRFLQAIDYAEIIFYIDPYNMQAFRSKVKSLQQLGRTVDAYDFSRHFRSEYRKDYGEELENVSV